MAKKSTDSASNGDLETDLDLEVEPDEELEDETDEDEDLEYEEDQDEETEDESDESDDEDEDEESESFNKRLTQFKGDTPTEYAKNLENGYLETSKEGVRLAKENKELKASVDRINQLIATNPEFAEAINDNSKAEIPQIPNDPAIAWAQAERDKQWKKEYENFTDRHPEIETDPVLADALNTQLQVVREVIAKTEVRLVGMEEGLTKAWKLLGKDDSEEKLLVAAKDTASKGKSVGGKNHEPVSKVKFTESQIEVAMSMMNVDRKTAIKQLSTHNK